MGILTMETKPIECRTLGQLYFAVKVWYDTDSESMDESSYNSGGYLHDMVLKKGENYPLKNITFVNVPIHVYEMYMSFCN